MAKAALRRLRGLVPGRPRPAILMYHRIAVDSFDPWGLAVSPASFEAQLRWLADNRVLLPLAEFAERHRGGSLPPAAVAITFDDGYACVAQVAAPLLERLAVPATVFLPAELIERGTAFWWDELQHLVLRSDRPTLRVGELSVPLGGKRPDDSDWKPGLPPRTARQGAFHRIWEQLRPLAPGELDRAIAQLREEAAISEPPVDCARPMSTGEVRAAAGGRIEFGSHALTHPWLTSLAASEKAREIGESVGKCEALTGTRPAAFAYPYGNFDAQSERLVEQAGFGCACATGGSAVSSKSRPFALPRVQVGNWDAARLGRALARLPA